jgi:hypothetical protein
MKGGSHVYYCIYAYTLATLATTRVSKKIPYKKMVRI